MIVKLVMEILLLVGLVIVAGLLSLSEFVLAASRRRALRERADRGDRGASNALELTARLEKTLPAVRIGAIVAFVLAGTVVVALLESGDGSRPSDLGSPVAAYALAVGIVTLVLLLVAEFIPRRLALHEPERIVSRLSWLIRGATLAAVPFVLILGPISRMILRARPIGSTARPHGACDEIAELLGEWSQGGDCDPTEVEIFKRVFRFRERRARVIMTPRAEIAWIDLADSPEEIRQKVVRTPHSWFPVCDQSLDNLLGIVQVKDLLTQGSEGPMFRVKGFLTLPAFIFEGTRGPQILESLRQSSTHTAVVLDEYGSVVGLLTLKDILESLLGNIPKGRSEADDSPVVLRPDGSRLIDGRFPIDEFRELYRIALPAGDYHTLAGLVVTQLGHIPRASETLVLHGLRFEVVEVSGNRVVRVLVSAQNGESERG